MENQFKITEKVLEAYEKANDYGKEILEGIFGKEAFGTDIKGKVKTFMDAVEILGIKNQTVKDYYDIANKTDAKDILAFAKLKVIAEALNEEWKPNTDIYMGNYYTSFLLYTKEEYEELDAKKKLDCLVICRTDEENIYAEVDSKLAVSYVDIDYKISFKSRELARYCGWQFFDIWKDYLFG